MKSRLDPGRSENEVQIYLRYTDMEWRKVIASTELSAKFSCES